jgi:hypothetical protein
MGWSDMAASWLDESDRNLKRLRPVDLSETRAVFGKRIDAKTGSDLLMAEPVD